MKTMELYGAMGQAVAERTFLRKKGDGSWEKWGDVAERVAAGSAQLCDPNVESVSREYEALKEYIGSGSILTSGRFLQHGDLTMPNRNMEVYTNCSTAFTSFASVYLLLNGSGVGRCYDDDLMLVDWDNAPSVVCVLDCNHPDFDYDVHESARDAKHKYGQGRKVVHFKVPDHREGWASAVEKLEVMAFEKIHRDSLLVLDFSDVRAKGEPIAGMQGRPASGPVPLMAAFNKIASIKGAGLPRWFQAMLVDHWLADCVLMGGVRRSARLACKHWKDAGIFQFIQVKRPVEFLGLDWPEVEELRKNGTFNSHLWTANNSVLFDQEFWDLIRLTPRDPGYNSDLAVHARKVFDLCCRCSYHDATGEPGGLNQHKFKQTRNNLPEQCPPDLMVSPKYHPHEGTTLYHQKLWRVAITKNCFMIVNPCGEIQIALFGAFCVVGDLAPFFCDTLDEVLRSARLLTRLLIRTNTLPSVYQSEVRRTNRIGVGITGIFEFAWKFFGLGFRDLLDENGKGKPFWDFMLLMGREVTTEAKRYSALRGMVQPDTDKTMKPAGTTSKAAGLGEGAHLPAMAEYLRWVQFSANNPLVALYKAAGYPFRDDLVGYKNTVIIGFPTAPRIVEMVPREKLMLAGDATPEQQFEWIRLVEKYWLGVGDEDDRSNSVSYTLKYNPTLVSYKGLRRTLKRNLKTVKCVSVMPQTDGAAYEYLPEEAVSPAEYQAILGKINDAMPEDINKVHVECVGASCPVDFNNS